MATNDSFLSPNSRLYTVEWYDDVRHLFLEDSFFFGYSSGADVCRQNIFLNRKLKAGKLGSFYLLIFSQWLVAYLVPTHFLNKCWPILDT